MPLLPWVPSHHSNTYLSSNFFFVPLEQTNMQNIFSKKKRNFIFIIPSSVVHKLGYVSWRCPLCPKPLPGLIVLTLISLCLKRRKNNPIFSSKISRWWKAQNSLECEKGKGGGTVNLVGHSPFSKAVRIAKSRSWCSSESASNMVICDGGSQKSCGLETTTDIPSNGTNETNTSATEENGPGFVI